MKRLVLGGVVLIGCGAVAVWLAWPHLVERLRVRLEHEVSRALGSPSRIDVLSVSVVPLEVHVGGIVLGTEPALLQVGRVDARLLVLASLMSWRPVLTLRVESVVADLTRLPKAEPSSTPPRAPAKSEGLKLPPLDLTEFELVDAQMRFPMGKDVAHLTVGHVSAQLHTALIGAALTAGVEVQNVELERKSYRARIQILRVEGGADAGGLFVEHGSLEGDGITASARSTLIAHRHAVSATFNPGILGVVVDELSAIGGQAQLDGTLIGDLANPVLDGRLTIREGAIGTHVLGDLDTHVGRAGPTLRFDELHLVGAKGGDVSGAVELTVIHEVPIHAALTWHSVDLQSLLRTIGTSVPFSDRINATTAVHGTLDPLDLDVGGTGILHSATDEPKEVARFEIGSRIQPHNLDATLAVTQAQQNRVSAHVTLAGKQFGGSVALQAEDLISLNAILPHPVPLLALSGKGDANVQFSGTIEAPVVGGTLALRDLTLLGVPASRLAGDFRIAGGTLTINSARLDTRAGGATLGGVLALDERATNDWRVGVRDLSNDLWLGLAYRLAKTSLPVSSGVLNGSVSCKGTWRQAEADVNLVASALRIAAEPIDRVELRAHTTLPRWNVSINAVRTPSETLTIQGAGDDATLQLAFDSTPLQLATLRGAGRQRVTGVVTLEGHLSGALRQPSGALQLTATDVGAGGHRLGDIALQASGRDGGWTVGGAAFADTVTLNASLRTVGALPFTFDLGWQDTDLSQLVSEDRSLSLLSTGTLSLSGALQTLRDLSGALRVTRFDVRRDEGHVELAEPIRIRLDKGRLQIEALALSAAGSRLSVVGEGRLPAELDLTVLGEGDLVLLEVIGRPFYSARGQFGVSAHVGHSAARGWTLRGQANLRNAALDLGLPVSFTDTSGEFALLGPNVLVQHLGGRAGGGDFRVSGKLSLVRGPALKWSLHEVGLTFPDWLEEQVSGKGTVEGSWQDLTVDGDIDVLNALYDKNIELTGLIPWFKEQVTPAPRTTAPATIVRLDLRIRAADGIFVDNNYAKAELSADLRVTGTATQPSLQGRVEILSGEATVGSRVFTITGGSAVFQPGERINPILNVNAESRISGTDADYTVQVAVTGTADRPRVQFSSDEPGLSQNDMLSLVALGRTTREQSRDSGVGVGDILTLLPSEYVGEVRNFLRIDRFEVDPAYVRTTGSVEPRVTIGKDLTDRIRALASTSFGADARNTMQLEYRITGRISLLGTWESQSQSQSQAFGGDIRFRYEFRRVRFSLLNNDGDQPQRSNAH